MVIRFVIFLFLIGSTAIVSNERADAFTLGYSRGLNYGLERIQFSAPVLAPFPHTRFCLQYPDDCKVHRMAFRGSKLIRACNRLIRVSTLAFRILITRPAHCSPAAVLHGRGNRL